MAVMVLLKFCGFIVTYLTLLVFPGKFPEIKKIDKSISFFALVSTLAIRKMCYNLKLTWIIRW